MSYYPFLRGWSRYGGAGVRFLTRLDVLFNFFPSNIKRDTATLKVVVGTTLHMNSSKRGVNLFCLLGTKIILPCSHSPFQKGSVTQNYLHCIEGS
ncbi:hypothetical protein ERO13_D07G133950v2 [Gossypium hirsutum]|uniref:Uncharacterized protein n=2 Tax=Gossypium TaxID=3633 RepID=A0A5D2K7G2_GOSTO|nr:hypothetical protein ERO13_D07G133950v2 [Gossypium hirsutum]TYG61500.1 hypothetical protein ES288_D07G153400v1 [Gossypium darwinii]TYH62884.1 hypothetical protein ES332_D07G151000v1 [Gossypium tomentosum]